MSQPFTTYEPDAETVRRAACFDELVAALRDIETHHVAQNALKGRDENRSLTLRLARAALAKAEAKP